MNSILKHKHSDRDQLPPLHVASMQIAPGYTYYHCDPKELESVNLQDWTLITNRSVMWSMVVLSVSPPVNLLYCKGDPVAKRITCGREIGLVI